MNILRLSTLSMILVAFAGCSGDAAKPAEKPPETPPQVTPSDMQAAPTPEIVAKLEKADAADGKTDKVVEKCAGCSLGMNGNPAHAVKVGGYTLNFCDHCADGKAKDPMKVLTALVVK